MRRVVHIVIGLLLIIVGLGVSILTETWWIAWLVGAPAAFFGTLALLNILGPESMSQREERRILKEWEAFGKAFRKATKNQSMTS